MSHFVIVVCLSVLLVAFCSIRLLPNPIWKFDGAEVCLIVKDHKGEGHEQYKGRLANHVADARTDADGGGCLITKVIGISKLKAKYKQFEARRKLRDSYDLFVVDDRVVQMMPQLLGKTFFKYDPKFSVPFA